MENIINIMPLLIHTKKLLLLTMSCPLEFVILVSCFQTSFGLTVIVFHHSRVKIIVLFSRAYTSLYIIQSVIVQSFLDPDFQHSE